METTFLFHTILNGLVPGAIWRDDHTLRNTTAHLTSEGHTARLEWVWPIHDAGWSLDVLTDGDIPMINRVLDTFNRHVATGRVTSLTCYMQPRKPPTALSDPGWIEWGVVVRYGEDPQDSSLFIMHLQRQYGADVERHT